MKLWSMIEDLLISIITIQSTFMDEMYSVTSRYGHSYGVNKY